MKNILMAAALAATALTQTAHAGLLITTDPNSNVYAGQIAPKNDFKNVFANSTGALNFNNWADHVGLIAKRAGYVTFYAVGYEAKYKDQFNLNGSSIYAHAANDSRHREGYATWTPGAAGKDPLNPGVTSPIIGQVNVVAGTDMSTLINFTSSHNPSAAGNLGTNGFGVFWNGGKNSIAAERNWFGFGYDDQPGGNPDGNHDDLFILAKFTSTVPEASTWLMMLLGFGVAGYGLRSRNRLMQTA